MIYSPLYLLLFSGCRWGEGPCRAGWSYWAARTTWRHRSCWANGRERRASKIWNIAYFLSWTTVSTNTYCTITSHHRVINSMCSHFGIYHYENDSRKEVKETYRKRQRESMVGRQCECDQACFLGLQFPFWCATLTNLLCCYMRIISTFSNQFIRCT